MLSTTVILIIADQLRLADISCRCRPGITRVKKYGYHTAMVLQGDKCQWRLQGCVEQEEMDWRKIRDSLNEYEGYPGAGSSIFRLCLTTTVYHPAGFQTANDHFTNNGRRMQSCCGVRRSRVSGIWHLASRNGMGLHKLRNFCTVSCFLSAKDKVPRVKRSYAVHIHRRFSRPLRPWPGGSALSFLLLRRSVLRYPEWVDGRPRSYVCRAPCPSKSHPALPTCLHSWS